MDQGQLEQTALEVIRALKSIPRYSDLKVAVIGGLARMHYNPIGRFTDVSSTASLVGWLHKAYIVPRMWTLSSTPLS